MKKLAAVLLTSTAFAAPAFAGGPVLVEPEPVIVVAPAPVVAYGADWSGAYVGGQLGYADAGSNTTGLEGNGGTYGVHGGYRWDMGNAVVGVEADWDKTDIDLDAAGSSLDSIARLKLIGGYDMGQTLVYATAGAAKAKGNLAGTDFSENGWSLGAGLTYAVNDQWTVGGEVLKNQFDDVDGAGTDLDATTATLRVGFKF
ncbi:outer membrane beta-barrel protein [Xinfangfangia sp. CPCC 101601]|uniref:Outer membrane beta-barrel protein n=1 Tax=Pseudogemmobacter lacusdianii TaxID=3069608 RepID=A0ABU0VV55_9RHOB|nr:outer membrane beta-barrel protein [Xinfangfangia sp. CPCC 101601]MDQ2065568.1 outer membrane beta-barrel protein [Xinfangfangia sp. CPCC 101601]